MTRGNGVILIEHGPEGRPVVFDTPLQVFSAFAADEVLPALRAAEAARQAGHWIAGYVGYEAGYAFEDKLAPLAKRGGEAPLLVLAAYAAPEPAEAVLAAARAGAALAGLSDLAPEISRAEYGAAFDRVKAYIAAGDCYQINLTLPWRARLVGEAIGLYGRLQALQPVGFGALVDLGVGPVLISRSPELFFSVEGGRIEARPMKGTAPRSDDPVEDAMLAAALRGREKDRAENLMIVDLLRNDIARMARVGSVKVPELFAIESYATVHQMISRVQGDLLRSAGVPEVMAALFPCGSITGAPKIRAMEIIAEVEPQPRGAYCGAIGWAAPDDRQVWNVAIRTLRVTGAEVTFNVGGGIVHDSDVDQEWEETLWKARFATRAMIPG